MIFTHDCLASQNNATIITFANDTTVIGLISGDDESAYSREVAGLVKWCQDNNLSLNVSKIKEMIADPRTRREQHPSLHIAEPEVERLSTFKFHSVHISPEMFHLD